jgi:glycogen phosphorylase
MTVQEVEAVQAAGYRPLDRYEHNDELRAAIDLVAAGHFSHGDRQLFRPLLENLLYQDPYLVLADYQSYVECQERVSRAFMNSDQWTRMSIQTVSRMGKFSSDRSIREYSAKVWQVEPFPITLKWQRVPEGGIRFPKLE